MRHHQPSLPCNPSCRPSHSRNYIPREKATTQQYSSIGYQHSTSTSTLASTTPENTSTNSNVHHLNPLHPPHFPLPHLPLRLRHASVQGHTSTLLRSLCTLTLHKRHRIRRTQYTTFLRTQTYQMAQNELDPQSDNGACIGVGWRGICWTTRHYTARCGHWLQSSRYVCSLSFRQSAHCE